MKHRMLFRILTIFGIIFLLWGGLYYSFLRTSINRIPEGDFLCESTSPKGTYVVKLYVTSPALSVGGTRGEVINNETGKGRNIYWEYNRNLFEAGITENIIIWESDEVVTINGKRLNVKTDTYDWRRK